MSMHRMLIGFREDDLEAIDAVKRFNGLSNRTETVRFCITATYNAILTGGKLPREAEEETKPKAKKALPRR